MLKADIRINSEAPNCSHTLTILSPYSLLQQLYYNSSFANKHDMLFQL